jgi:uncharacterized metal-binding protein
MSCSCSVAKNTVMLLTCSGASNVGQISNRAAIELNQEGLGKMSCLAGVGGQLNSFVKAAQEAPVIAAIDGCSVGCSKAILMNAGIQSFRHIVLTDHGFEKNKNFELNEMEVNKAKDIVRSACAYVQPKVVLESVAPTGRCCG